MTEEAGPRIGYWGRSNLASFGELARPLVFEAEIRRRIPGAQVQSYAPLGPRHPGAPGDALPAADLGQWSPIRIGELAETLDCAVVGTEGSLQPSDARLCEDYGADAPEAARSHPSGFFLEGLGIDREGRCPLSWDAVSVPARIDRASAARFAAAPPRPYLSVRDPESRERLLRAGVRGEIAVVPDPLLLLPQTFSPSVLSRRLEFIRHMEWFPREQAALVLEGDRALLRSAEAIADSIAEAASRLGVRVVLLDLERADAEFLDAVARVLPAPLHRVPSDAGLLDRVAVLANARTFIGTSRAGATAAAAFGTPVLRLTSSGLADLGSEVPRLLSSPRGAAGPPAELRERLDAHFDALARVADDAFARRLQRTGDQIPRLLALLRESDRRIEAWRLAWEARSRQVVEARLEMAAVLDGKEADRAAREDASARELAETRSERDIFRGEVDRLAAAAEAERGARQTVEAELSGAAAEISRLRAEGERSAQGAAALQRDLDAARQDTKFARDEAERRAERADSRVVALRADLERAEARLSAFRAAEAELRLTQTLLYTELAEARSDASRLAGNGDAGETAGIDDRPPRERR